MAPTIEETIACLLRAILDGLADDAIIENSEAFRNVLNALNFFLPAILAERHPEWKHESLDGIYPDCARKTGPNDVEISGVCILISDQTLTPLHVCLQISASGNEIEWLECTLGVRGEGKLGMLRVPYDAMSDKQLVAATMGKDKDIFDWAFMVGFGQRQSVRTLRPAAT
jgi:hypothetical protein